MGDSSLYVLQRYIYIPVVRGHMTMLKLRCDQIGLPENKTANVCVYAVQNQEYAQQFPPFGGGVWGRDYISARAMHNYRVYSICMHARFT